MYLYIYENKSTQILFVLMMIISSISSSKKRLDSNKK